jgi:hypothetical protein
MFVLLALLLLAWAPATASAIVLGNMVTNVTLSPHTPNILSQSQDVTINFSYNTVDGGGVMIFPRPVTHGVLTLGYGASGSPIYPVGSGTGSGWFHFISGSPTVDHIRFQMWNASQTTLLYQASIPVHYQYTSLATNFISRIGLTATPNVLKQKQRVSVTFHYKTNRASGVRIFARPLSGSVPTPHYAASGSPLYAVGSGTGSASFTVTSGSATVTKVRLTMWNSTQTKLLFKADVPVSYQFRPGANIVNSIKLTPAVPNIFPLGNYITLNFRYTTNHVGGVRIWARPMTAGVPTPHYAASGSPLYTIGTGSGTADFSILSGAVTVNQIRFQMWNNAQTKLLFSAKIPISLQFK